VDEATLLRSLKTGFGQHVALEDAGLNDFEKALTEQLTRDKYGSESWTLRK
jgi:lipoate-protein ligase A